MRNALATAAVRALRGLGGLGTRGVALAMVSATLLPGLGDTFRPILGEAVFALLTIAFVRLQPAAMRLHLRHPAVPLAACVWTMLAIPLLGGLLCQWLGVDELAPQIYLAIMLQVISSPLIATPALAALLGLDATLVLIVMVSSSALVPFSAAFFSHLFFSGEFDLAPGMLGVRLFVLLAGSAALGLLLRRALGLRRVAALKLELDGINIIVLFIFAAAIMGSVIPNLIDRPLTVLKLTAIVFGMFITLQVLSTAIFLRTGRSAASALGFVCSHRNMGMMLVATAGAVSEQVWLYCALAQLPIYFGPMLIAPVLRRFLRNEDRGDCQAR